MKLLHSLFFAGLLFSAAAAGADNQPADPSLGQHGMVLFGGQDGLYASHMPMFHAPHDAQVLLAIRIADRKIDRAMRRELDLHPAMWSLVPERFELVRLSTDGDRHLKKFHADLVKGHFERGGKMRYKNVDVQIESVLAYSKLDVQPKLAASADYFILGKEGGRDAFIVKKIAARPDVDQIIAVTAPSAAKLPKTMRLPLQGELTMPSDILGRQLHEACNCEVGIKSEIYRETGDLQ